MVEKGSELEDRTIQLIQSKKTKGKKIKETWKKFRDQWDSKISMCM